MCEDCVVPGSSPPLCKVCLRHLDAGPYVKHIKALGVLLILHGGLLLAMGTYYVFFGGFMVDALTDIPADPNDPLSELVPNMVVAVLGLMGVAQVLPGVLQLVGGWRLFRYEGTSFAWAGALAGLMSLLGCYCGPSAIALAAYGVFILSRDDVRARFAVGQAAASSGS